MEQTTPQTLVDLKAKRRRLLIWMALVQAAMIAMLGTAGYVFVVGNVTLPSLLSANLPLLTFIIALAAGALFAMMITTVLSAYFASRRTPSVFVSFSQKDRALVDELITKLSERGVPIRRAEDTIRVGDDIVERLDELATRSTHAIVVVSPNYDQLQWAAIEIAMLDHRTKILPLLYNTDSLPRGLQGMQTLKVTEVTPAVIESLLAALPHTPPPAPGLPT